MTNKQLERYKGDHFAQQLWSIGRGYTRPVNLYEANRLHEPPKFKVYGAGTPPRPVVLGYELPIPDWREVGYEGEIVTLTKSQYAELWSVYHQEDLAQAFSAYMGSSLCPNNCWAYDTANDIMRPTTYGTRNQEHALFTAVAYRLALSWLKREAVAL